MIKGHTAILRQPETKLDLFFSEPMFCIESLTQRYKCDRIDKRGECMSTECERLVM